MISFIVLPEGFVQLLWQLIPRSKGILIGLMHWIKKREKVKCYIVINISPLKNLSFQIGGTGVFITFADRATALKSLYVYFRVEDGPLVCSLWGLIGAYHNFVVFSGTILSRPRISFE